MSTPQTAHRANPVAPPSKGERGCSSRACTRSGRSGTGRGWLTAFVVIRPASARPGASSTSPAVDSDTVPARASALIAARAIADAPEPGARGGGQVERDLAVVEQVLEPRDLDVDDRPHVPRAEAVEQDDLIEAIEELGAEMAAIDVNDLALDLRNFIIFTQRSEILAAEI